MLCACPLYVTANKKYGTDGALHITQPSLNASIAILLSLACKEFLCDPRATDEDD